MYKIARTKNPSKIIHVRTGISQYERLERLVIQTQVCASEHIRCAIERYLKAKLTD
jgi:predicted DNA-binding protein